jgi:hypothetical protein
VVLLGHENKQKSIYISDGKVLPSCSISLQSLSNLYGNQISLYFSADVMSLETYLNLQLKSLLAPMEVSTRTGYGFYIILMRQLD